MKRVPRKKKKNYKSKKFQHNRVKKKKRNKLPIAVLPQQSNGISNWEQLRKMLNPKMETPVMTSSSPSVKSYPLKCPSSKGNIAQSKTFPKENRSLSRTRHTVNKQNHSSDGPQTKSAFSGIRDIGNTLPPTKNGRSSDFVLNSDNGKRVKPRTELNSCNLPSKTEQKDVPLKRLTRRVAMDCEMVGTGPNGVDSMIARVSIVNRYGDCLYDAYVKPKDDITDYRTSVSGIRPSDLTKGKDLFTVQKEVLNIIEGRILIGHALKNDLDVLFISHPKSMIRDTARYKPFRSLFDGRTPSLKKLAAKLLQIEIQSGEHNSVEDARAAMQIYLTHKTEWEKSLKRNRKKKTMQQTNSLQNSERNVQEI